MGNPMDGNRISQGAIKCSEEIFQVIKKAMLQEQADQNAKRRVSTIGGLFPALKSKQDSGRNRGQAKR